MNILPCKANLFKKKVTNNPMCPRCLDKEKTINHILFQCPFAINFWFASPLTLYSAFMEGNCFWSSWRVFLQIASNSGNLDEIIQWIIFRMWILWKARNNFIFKHQTVSPIEVINLTSKQCQDYIGTLVDNISYNNFCKNMR
ncbi:hypothetical protein Syun_028307 [Stephania yunnanensis]|uniref:Reverse transcriptase zinc-binding domain-containing protein n=1 Tax=Stephania yunnanensis TaxID=152371 RepID=A0AAP0EH41_9MAGN